MDGGGISVSLAEFRGNGARTARAVRAAVHQHLTLGNAVGPAPRASSARHTERLLHKAGVMAYRLASPTASESEYSCCRYCRYRSARLRLVAAARSSPLAGQSYAQSWQAPGRRRTSRGLVSVPCPFDRACPHDVQPGLTHASICGTASDVIRVSMLLKVSAVTVRLNLLRIKRL
jgi:hypothetical protein